MAHDSGLDDETLAGGTPDDYEYDYGPPPSGDGSCHCGATVLSTDPEPCLFCGGYTQQQLDSMTEE